MTDEEKANELRRLSQKIELWDSPGFFQFVRDFEDIFDYMEGLPFDEIVEELRKRYLRKISELTPERKFTQIKLDI